MSVPVSQEDLMRYLDGELPPEERERVEAGVRASTELQRELALFQALSDDLHDLSFQPPRRPDTVWGAVHRRLTRPLGWVLLSVGVVIWTGYGTWVFYTSPVHVAEKLGIAGIVIGLVLLMAGVAYDQYHAWLQDPYRNVHR